MRAGSLVALGAAIILTLAQHAQAMTMAECQRTAGVPGDTDTRKIPHFCYGTWNQEVEILTACTKHRLDFNKPCFLFTLPLHVAAARVNEPMIAALIRAGADVRLKSEIGWSAMHSVVNACAWHVQPPRRDECIRIIKLLASAGADINEPDPHGSTPFWMAMGNAEFMEDLIALGADFNRQRNWETPLDHAIEMRLEKAVVVLQKHRAERASGVALALQKVRKFLKHYEHFPFPPH